MVLAISLSFFSKTAIDEGALSIMVNSGEVNGIPVHASYELLTKVLRDELGFEGIILTDWEDIIKLYKDHHIAANMKEAVLLAINAGVDMSMTPNNYSFNDALIELVKEGSIKESRLDESVRRILIAKEKLGLFETPYPNFDNFPKFGSKEHALQSLQAAKEAITLVKNDSILPLSTSTKILVTGPGANSLNYINGGWTHTWQGDETKYNTPGKNTIQEALKTLSPNVTYMEGSGLDTNINTSETLKEAENHDVIVVCLAEDPAAEKETARGNNFLLFQAVPSWMFSLAVHTVILVILGLMVLVSPVEEMPSLTSVMTKNDLIEEIVDDLTEPIDEPVEITPTETLDVETEVNPIEDVSEVEEIEIADDVEAPAAAVEFENIANQVAPQTDLLSSTESVVGAGLSGRGAESRAAMVRDYGGTKESEVAVAMALKWIANHQNPDGGWSFDHTAAGRRNCTCGDMGTAKTSFNGATAMALLPFLGAGNTHKKGEYKKQVEAGLYYLKLKLKQFLKYF